MRAWQLQSLAGPAALELVDLPEPAPRSGSVLIDVRTAGVSFADVLVSRGEYQIRPEPPFVPCTDVAGVVRSAPEGSAFAPGQRVGALVPLGGCAQVALAPEQAVFPIADGVSDAAAVAITANYQTAYLGLHHRGAVTPGESVLVHGASGGVGSAAIQVAKALGATTIAVARGAHKAAQARDAGADQVLDADEDWVAGVRDITAGGADVVFDTVGGERFDRSLRCMAREGRLLVVGFTSGTIPQLSVNQVLLKDIAVIGVNIALASDQLRQGAWSTLMTWAQERRIEPLIGATYPFENAPQAFEDIAARRAIGKLVIDVQPPAPCASSHP
jgi:NADPH2:quinone reductase